MPFGTIRAVRLDILTRVVRIEIVIQCLAVVDAGIRDFIGSDQLVVPVGVHTVFVAVKYRAVFLCPARVRILMSFVFVAPVGRDFLQNQIPLAIASVFLTKVFRSAHKANLAVSENQKEAVSVHCPNPTMFSVYDFCRSEAAFAVEYDDRLKTIFVVMRIEEP